MIGEKSENAKTPRKEETGSYQDADNVCVCGKVTWQKKFSSSSQ